MEIPHCPNPHCTCFTSPQVKKWYIRYGYHRTRAFGTIQRFRCLFCGRTFSAQTFHIDYYAKKRMNYTSLLEQLVTGSGLLDISRKMKARPETIENRFERLARCVLAIHSDLLASLPMSEDLVADGFETFSYSQYYPNHVHIAAGRTSEFIYTLGFANLRRKGRMTRKQRQKRTCLERSGKAHPKAIETSMYHIFADLTQRLIKKGITNTILYTDEHVAYLRALEKITARNRLFHHVRISSKDRRNRALFLFAVDYLDRQFRKDLSDHVRETVQFARCPSALMVRMAVYRFYHNCCIPRRVRASRQGNDETHAERAGVSQELLHQVIKRHWGMRAFLMKTSLCCEERNTWLCQWRNPGLPFGRYIPKYIFT